MITLRFIIFNYYSAPIIIYVWIVMTSHHAPNVKIISARKSFIFNMQQKKDEEK